MPDGWSNWDRVMKTEWSQAWFLLMVDPMVAWHGDDEERSDEWPGDRSTNQKPWDTTCDRYALSSFCYLLATSDHLFPTRPSDSLSTGNRSERARGPSISSAWALTSFLSLSYFQRVRMMLELESRGSDHLSNHKIRCRFQVISLDSHSTPTHSEWRGEAE